MQVGLCSSLWFMAKTVFLWVNQGAIQWFGKGMTWPDTFKQGNKDHFSCSVETALQQGMVWIFQTSVRDHVSAQLFLVPFFCLGTQEGTLPSSFAVRWGHRPCVGQWHVISSEVCCFYAEASWFFILSLPLQLQLVTLNSTASVSLPPWVTMRFLEAPESCQHIVDTGSR